MRTAFDLTPLFRSTIGFDRFGDLIDSALRGEDNTPSYPPYNIEKLSDDEYRIVVAVAGFKEEDITLIAGEPAYGCRQSSGEEREQGKKLSV